MVTEVVPMICTEKWRRVKFVCGKLVDENALNETSYLKSPLYKFFDQLMKGFF